MSSDILAVIESKHAAINTLIDVNTVLDYYVNTFGLTILEEVRTDISRALAIPVSERQARNYIADFCINKVSSNLEYGEVASRICMDIIHMITPDSIADVACVLYHNIDFEGKHSPLIAHDYYQRILDNKELLDSVIDMSRDYKFDYFGIRTLERSYLMKVKINGKQEIVERPQHMFMRVALGIHGDDIEAAIETYNLMTQMYFTHATPTLFNSGTPTPQLSSCFLLGVDDDLENILEQLKQIGLISKWAGGIGIHLSSIRAKGSIIRGTNGLSEGIIPYAIVLNKLSRYVNQGGKRKGSISIYLEPHHADIFEFCELRKTTTGNDENRARDLFLAVWISDLFMKRVEEDGIWSLMCPDECKGLNEVYGEKYEALYTKYENEGKFRRQVKARELFNHILTCQIETGLPYILFKDHANNKSNQKNLGTIKSSNLCVHEDTYILTNKGHLRIGDCVNRRVCVWNGFNWSNVIVRKTGTHKNLIRVNLSDGSYLDCTPQHKFYIEQKLYNSNFENEDVVEIEAQYLQPGHEIISSADPTRILLDCDDTEYTGCCPFLSELKGYLAAKLNRWFPSDDIYVPLTGNIDSRIKWFEGFVDAYPECFNWMCIEIHSRNHRFLFKLKLMLQLLGCFPIIKTLSDNTYSLELTNYLHLRNLGFNPKVLRRCKESILGQEMLRDSINIARQRVFVMSVENSYQDVDTYCFTEPVRHMGIFNGIPTGQCAEIIEYSDSSTTAVCNLASICLPRFIVENEDGIKIYDYDKLMEVTRVVVRNLNKIIDINYYINDNVRKSNITNRPIGIGVQGLANVYNAFSYPYESDKAREMNKRIFETIYYAALDESKELAKKYGKYDNFDGSPFSQGLLQYHLWNKTEEDLLMGFDWRKLIEEIKQYGTRNSLLTALMPTAGTAQIMGCYEGFEPYMSNIFIRSTMAGDFVTINKNLIMDLDKLGLWNEDMRKKIIIYNGSVQNIDEIPDHIKAIYKTAFEIKLKSIITQAAERGIFIDQSQSMNLFMQTPEPYILTSAHFYSWKSGLKTGMYYLRTTPVINPNQYGIDIEDVKRLTGANNIEELLNQGSNGTKTKPIPEKKKGTACKFRPGMTMEECLMCSS